ncbi:MAG: hypothetical protein ACKO37_06840 [Vampirovibrionales bacterium]
MEMITPEQFSHIWSTAGYMLATKAMEQGTSHIITHLGDKYNTLKTWLSTKCKASNILALLDNTTKNPEVHAKLQSELEDTLSVAQWKELQQMMLSIQELVEQLQPQVLYQNTQTHSGTGNIAGGDIIYHHYYGQNDVKKNS